MAQVLNKIYIWCSTLRPLNQLSSKKRVKAFALTGREDSTMRNPQGVASLALGYVHHWAFSPSLLNPKLQLSLQYVTIREIIFFREFDEFYHNLDERTQEKYDSSFGFSLPLLNPKLQLN